MNKLEYKGYQAEVVFDAEDSVLYGKILDINDHIIFEIDNPENAASLFAEAVNDYLEMCRDIGKEPDKAYSGVFNVRIPKELHKKAVQTARKDNITLNKFVENAISLALNKDEYAMVINIFPYSSNRNEEIFSNETLLNKSQDFNSNNWVLQ